MVQRGYWSVHFMMKIFAVLALCLASTLASPYGWTKALKHRIPASGRIIGGAPASIGQFPWQVTVIGHNAQGSWVCGGSLIGNQWVLTAAHCIQGATSFTILLGGITLWDAEEGRISLTAIMAIMHPNFNVNTLSNDIGLIRISTSVEFSERIHPVALASRDDFVEAGRTLTVSGWGRTSDASPSMSEILRYVEVTSISNAQCAAVYGSAIVIGSTLCTRGNPNHGTCAGDSGGPLVSVDENGFVTQVGVVTFTPPAGCEVGAPSAFIRVQPFLNWIAANTGLEV